MIEYIAVEDTPPYQLVQCKRCGTVVNDTAIHSDWHHKLAALLSQASTPSFWAILSMMDLEEVI